MIWYKKIGIYVLSGILLGIGFVIPFLWPLGILGAGLLLHRLLISEDSWRKKLLGTYGAMFIKFMFVLSSYWTMYPITWLPFDFGSWELAIIALYWVSVSLYLAFSGLVLYGLIVASKIIGVTNWLRYFVIVPIVWIVSELSGSFILSIFTIGPGSEPNISFSLGYVGYLLGEHQILAQIARLGGVYALSFALILAAVSLFLFWPKWTTKTKLLVITLLVISSFTSTISLPVRSVGSGEQTIALINTNIPVGNLFVKDGIDVYKTTQEDAMRAASDIKPKYILWPEDARYFSQLAGDRGTMVFSFANTDEDVVVIDSGRVNTENGKVLRAQILDVESKKTYIADKRYLVPQGEFMPFLYKWFFHTIGLGEVATKVEKAVSFIVGPEISQADFPNNIPGVLFCFESTDANAVRALMNERDDIPFIVHPVSHVWFHEPKTFWSQLDTSLRVQAIWNQVYIARAGSHAPSKLYTPTGAVIEPETIASGKYWSVGLVSIPSK